MSIFDKNIISGKTKLQISIERIQNFCANKKTLIAFSGGKDSQCCYHLAKDAKILFHAEYSITRFEPPELISFVKDNYPDVTFRRAYRYSLVDEIKRNGPPSRWARWCCNAKHVKTNGYDIAIIGVRAQESPRRKKNWRIFGQKKDRTFYICPIFDWTEDEVWEYLNYKNVKHCSLYDEGYKRIGCVCCPLASSKKMQEDEKRWPKTANMLRICFRKHWEYWDMSGRLSKNGKLISIFNFANPDEAFDYWIQHGTLNKKHTKIEEETPCLFAGTGFSESDGIEESSGEEES